MVEAVVDWAAPMGARASVFERRKHRIAAAVGLGYRTRRQMGKAVVTFTLDTRLCFRAASTLASDVVRWLLLR